MSQPQNERSGALGLLCRIDDGLARFEGWLVVAALFLMLLLYFLYVVFRNISAPSARAGSWTCRCTSCSS